MLIRRELTSDPDQIDAVHRAAFAPRAANGEPVEVGLVRRLRDDTGWIPALSLVAEGPDGAVVGHVVCTRGSLPGLTAVGLGPVGVLPERQGTGVGGALMHAVLGGADALDVAVVVLLGHLDYYPRFGFVSARRIGIEPPDSSWGEHFQARPLSRWPGDVSGVFRFASPFDDL